jgi:hypothetical protein
MPIKQAKRDKGEASAAIWPSQNLVIPFKGQD